MFWRRLLNVRRPIGSSPVTGGLVFLLASCKIVSFFFSFFCFLLFFAVRITPNINIRCPTTTVLNHQPRYHQCCRRPAVTCRLGVTLSPLVHRHCAAQRQLDVTDVCPTGRVRAMCHVAPASGGGKDAGSWGSLVAVTSAGGVSVWDVPALEGIVDVEKGTGAALELPLRATLFAKVTRGNGWFFMSAQ